MHVAELLNVAMFECYSSSPKRINERMVFYNIAAVDFDALTEDTASITGVISYQRTVNSTEEDTDPNADVIVLDKLALEDRKGHR